MKTDRIDRQAARRDVQRQTLSEIGAADRLRRIARRARYADYSHLGMGTSVVLMTVLGVGSAACRQVPITVSSAPKSRRVVARPPGRKRWRNLRSIQREANNGS